MVTTTPSGANSAASASESPSRAYFGGQQAHPGVGASAFRLATDGRCAMPSRFVLYGWRRCRLVGLAGRSGLRLRANRIVGYHRTVPTFATWMRRFVGHLREKGAKAQLEVSTPAIQFEKRQQSLSFPVLRRPFHFEIGNNRQHANDHRAHRRRAITTTSWAGCSVMSVNHSSLGIVAVNRRLTRSTGVSTPAGAAVCRVHRCCHGV